MVAFHPIAPEMVDPAWATRVPAPAPDALTGDQLAALADREPFSFLHVTSGGPARPDESPLAQRVEQLQRLRTIGAFRSIPPPALLAYRITAGGHTQLGVIGDLEVASCDRGEIRRHEHTELAREDALLADRERLAVDSNPISVAFSPAGEVTRHLEATVAAPPAVSVTLADDARHELWPITDPSTVAAMTAAITATDAVYVLDGHHRIAAARRHAARTAPRDPTVGDPGRILAALFPRDQVQATDYRRVVRRAGTATAAGVWDTIRRRFAVTPVDDADAATPRRRGEIGLRLDGGWHRLVANRELKDGPLPDRLDEAIVQTHLLAAAFGIADPREDPTLTAVPGTVGLVELQAQVDPADAIVVLHPLPSDELEAVADAGVVLPPKSTHFTPKPAAGLVLASRHAAVPATR